jgi:hypothetical protein
MNPSLLFSTVPVFRTIPSVTYSFVNTSVEPSLPLVAYVLTVGPVSLLILVLLFVLGKDLLVVRDKSSTYIPVDLSDQEGNRESVRYVYISNNGP